MAAASYAYNPAVVRMLRKVGFAEEGVLNGTILVFLASEKGGKARVGPPIRPQDEIPQTKPAGAVQPPSNTRISHGDARRSICAPTAAALVVTQTAPERRWIMKARSCRLAVEAMEDRSVPSTVAYGDFNNDGLVDVAAVTNPTTITVSLANPDGTYTVSATLTAPKSLPIGGVNVGDYNADGNVDIRSGGLATSRFYSHIWLGDGDGTFGARDTVKGGRIRDGW